MSDMYYELAPVFDNCKSFYGKARVKVDGDDLQLFSYSTSVATVTYLPDGAKLAHITGVYSRTTVRHIREFLRQQGFKPGTKSELISEFYSNIVRLDPDEATTYLSTDPVNN